MGGAHYPGYPLPRTPPRSRPFRPRFYWSQGLTHYRVGNPTNDRFQTQSCMNFLFFSVSENGQSGLGDEEADGGNALLDFLG